MEGKRFVGIDLAKRHYEACVLEEQRPITRWSGKTDFEGRARLARYAQKLWMGKDTDVHF